jgi:hypothetical protein
MNDKINEVYTQRMLVVCMFAKAMGALGYSYGTGLDDNTSWDISWRTVVYVDTPDGQVSWHVAPDDKHIFEDFPEYTGVWDGKSNGCNADFVKNLEITSNNYR